MSHMFVFREAVPCKQAPAPAKQSEVDLEALSRETGVPGEVLRVFAAIADLANEHLFTAESARKAFAGAKVRHARA